MTIILRYLSEETEKLFRDWAESWGKDYFKTKRGLESKGFTILFKFFKSVHGQDAFKKWLLEESQKDPMEK